MLVFSFGEIVEILGLLGLLFVGGPALLIALGILAFPAGRRSRVGRRVAIGLLLLVLLFLLPASPLLAGLAGDEFNDLMAPARLEARTRRPEVPTTYDGILFPAGSTVVLEDREGGQPDSGHVESGTVPVETMILGLPLIGAFQLGHGEEDAHTVDEGTLARAAVIHELPCGPGAVVSEPEHTTCVLDHDADVRGFHLAGGSTVKEYRSPLKDPASLELGTLGGPQRLFDVTWPAGTIITDVGGSAAEALEHDQGVENQQITVCLARGAETRTPWGSLHGPASYAVNGDRILMSNFCVAVPDVDDPPGYALVGTARFTRGERAERGAGWEWTEPLSDAAKD